MNLVGKLVALPNLLMSKCSSIFLASNGNIFESFLDADTLITRILRVFGQFIYLAMKWVMYMIDVMYFYVLQLVGVTSDTSIFDSYNTDMTFRLLMDNKETITAYLKNFIAIALIMIIVTAIIAIIKQQSQALSNSKSSKTPTGDVLKSMFRAVLLIIITPLIAILAIVSSSVILQGLFRATNLSETKSLSARVFNASASQANKYKEYADNGVRIPIRYYFLGEDKTDAIVYASTMVANKSFPSLDYFDEYQTFAGDFTDPVLLDKDFKDSGNKSAVDVWADERYYAYFDRANDYNANYSHEQYKVLKTHKYEYYAMSDVIAYALDTMEPYYFVTIQELLESIKKANDSTAFKQIVTSYNIYLKNNSGQYLGVSGYTTFANLAVQDTEDVAEAMWDAIGTKSYSYIEYRSRYSSGEYTYTHVKNAVDEMDGAKFVIAYQAEKELNKTANSGDFVPNIYGNYVKDADATGTQTAYYEVEKFFYRANDKSRYKTVDLYYTFNNSLQRYEKATSIESGKAYFYRLGEDYYLITEENKDKFYYKLDGDYHSFTAYSYFFTPIDTSSYRPLSSNIQVGDYSKFTSEYIMQNSIITARGVFDNASYPTAIRRLSDGDVMFYRDDLVMVSDGSVSDVGKLEEIEAEDEETNQNQNFLQKAGSFFNNAWNSIKKFVSSIVNPLKLVPDLFIDESRIASTYTNETKSVQKLDDGKLHISYFFEDFATKNMLKHEGGIGLQTLFEPLSINYVILVAGAGILFKVILTAIFGLIGKSLNIFMMILTYPLACSTIPLDDVASNSKTGAYAKWIEKFTKLVFSSFSVILSLNIAFVIIPAIDKIDFFHPKDFVQNDALTRLGTALMNPWMIVGGKNTVVFTPNYTILSGFLNMLIRIIFQITVFSLISSANGKGGKGEDNFYSVIQAIVKPGGEGVLENSPLEGVKNAVKRATSTIKFFIAPIPYVEQVIAKSAEETAKAVQDFLPGSAVAKGAVDKYKDMTGRKQLESTRDALLQSLNGGSSADDVMKNLEAFKSTNANMDKIDKKMKR